MISKLLTHPSRFIRGSASFVLVLSCYWVYGLVAVPLIEPEAEVRASTQTAGSGAPVAVRRHSDIDALFGPDDWERRDPVMLENQRGKLLIGDYKNNPDGSVAISPCTIIMLPEGEFASEEERIRQAIVLQAVDKAVLRFDEPFDIRRGSIGKLVSGTLLGPILIRSDHKQPGPQDDLWIETRDVQLSQEMVTTDQAVKFRWGANHGSGRQMRIDLVPAVDKPGNSRTPQVAGLKALTLFREVRLHLSPDQKQMQAAIRPGAGKDKVADPSPGVAGNRWKPLPVEVTCRGPFRIDLEQKIATFQERVDVLQIQPEGPSDQLSGETLTIHFAAKGSPANPAEAARPDSNQRLEPRRLEMQGNPVIVRSPSNAVHARGQRLEYDLPLRRLSLAGEPEVVVTRGGDEIRARELYYQPGEQGRLGKFLAVGPGWLRGKTPDRPQPVEARWAKQLWIRPDPEAPANDVVSLEGDADARVPGMGGLKADEIYCWLLQRPVAAPASAPGGAVETKMEMAPDRVLARGQVQIDSPQLIGATDQLEAWFEHPAPPPAAAAPVATAVSYPPQSDAVAAPAAPSVPAPAKPSGLASLAKPSRGPVEQRFDVSGKLLRLKLLMNGREAQLSEVVLDGQARFAEIPLRQQTQPPMLVEGDVLHVVQTDPEQATVSVTGKPAHVNAGGMGLHGAAINLSRGTNQLWIDGEGRMTLQVDRDMHGRPLEKPQPLEVKWQGRMIFNGLTATFERTVTARTEQQLLQTEMLQITLSRRIDFSKAKQGERPDVAELVCRGGVELDSKTYDQRGLASIEHMESADLSLNRMTGKVLANAFFDSNRPAVMVQVRRGDNRAGLAVPGGTKEPAAGDEKDDGLSYLHVQFYRDLVGNLNTRQMTFGDRVKTVYGPVPAWDSVLTTESMGERGILLTCDRMVVREMDSAQPDVRATELEAIGNTSVEGSGDTFRATAAIIRYSSEKGKLTLEGDGRRDVTFFQRPANGADKSGSARRVEYTPERRYLRLIEVSSGSATER